MTDSHTVNRQSVPEQSEDEQHNSLDETTSLFLTRTRSLELNVAENTAIPSIVVDHGKPTPEDSGVEPGAVPWPRSVRYQVYMVSFFTSLSFAVTQVPLLYVFRLMTCDAYYKNHESQALRPSSIYPLWSTANALFSYFLPAEMHVMSAYTHPKPDRCSINEIEASTAMSFAILGASTTVFGIINLFMTSSLIKRLGVKGTLSVQILLAAARLFIQNLGVEVWGTTGILIIQCSQITSVIGGPYGYLLCLNTFISEVVEFEGRTAALGKLSGAMLFGTAFGLSLGGIVADQIGIKTSFRLTFVMFIGSMIYVAFTLPYIPPTENSKTDNAAKGGGKKNGLAEKILGPLTIFKPRKFVRRDGTVRYEFGVFLLGWGVFLGISATSFLMILLQLIATSLFGFGTQKNGFLVSTTALLRGVFLTLAFPRLIALGRAHTAKKTERNASSKPPDSSVPSERQPLLESSNGQSNDGRSDKNQPKSLNFVFDLTYARFSLLADSTLTFLCTFVNSGWQMYLAAALLPLGAGTSSASKGTILQMIGSSAESVERIDALAGITLVENMARLSNNFAFGALYAAFANIGQPRLVFTCNAACAFLGFIVLLFARFPPEGSRPLEEGEEERLTSPDSM